MKIIKIILNIYLYIKRKDVIRNKRRHEVLVSASRKYIYIIEAQFPKQMKREIYYSKFYFMIHFSTVKDKEEE